MKYLNADLTTKFFLFAALLFFSQHISGQSVCLTAEEAQKAVNLINAPQNVSENKALRLELLNMQEARQKLNQKILENLAENQKLIAGANELSEKNLLRLCQIIKQYGWTNRDLVGEDGMGAALSLIRAGKSSAFQRQLFPVIIAAAKKGLVSNGEVAWFVDSIRVSSGLAQIFGTQTSIRDETIYLLPLQNEAKIDDWRKLYDLPPLADFIKYLQSKYQMIVLKSLSLPVSSALSKEESRTIPMTNPLANVENDEVVKVETNLVTLNVSVNSADATNNNLKLGKDDFNVFEDGKKQEISFFSTTDAPFDLVLLLDLSGSTTDKQDLIRKSTARFIAAARPIDRIAIVTFTDQAKIIADLTQNHEELLKSVKKINDRGSSAVWGSLDFVLRNVLKSESRERRRAILLMSDGVDTSLLYRNMMPYSYPTFTDLLRTVRASDATIIPIYLETETKSDSWERQSYRTARQTLGMLAAETGGQMYFAKKIADLSDVYEKIISDLSKVYSISYEPSDNTRKNLFRELKITLPNYPNLIVHSKKGYYAR